MNDAIEYGIPLLFAIGCAITGLITQNALWFFLAILAVPVASKLSKKI